VVDAAALRLGAVVKPRRKISTVDRLMANRFLYWLGFAQPGWNGGVFTGLVSALIIFVASFGLWWWLGV
jgi:hypothetical protein